MSELQHRTHDANLLALNGDLAGATAEFERILVEIDAGRSFYGEAEVRSDFAHVLHNMGDSRESQQLTKAAALFQKRRDIPQFVDVCLRMFQLNKDSTTGAQYWVDRAIAAAERDGTPEDLRRPMAMRGQLLLEANRAAEALAVLEQVAALPGGDEYAELLAQAQVLTGHSDEGFRTLVQALDNAERSSCPNSATRIVTLRIRIADAKRTLGDREAALDLLKGALPHADARTDSRVYPILMDRLGFALLDGGEAAAAVETFERGIERGRAAAQPDTGVLGSLFSNLGNALAGIGNMRGSVHAFTKAIDLIGHGNPKSRSLALFGLANVAASIGGTAHAKARDAYEEARGLAAQLGDQSLEAACLDSLGQLEMKNKAPAKAVDLHRRAADLHRAIPDHRGAHIDLMNLVQSYLLLGEVAAARRTLDEVSTLAPELGRLPWQHAFRYGQVLSREGEWSEARPAFDAAIAQLERERDTLATPADQRRWAAQRVEAFELAAAAAFEAQDALAVLTYLEGNRARFLDAVAMHRRKLPAALSPAERDAYVAASNRLSDLRWRRREHPDRRDAELDRALAAATHTFDVLGAKVERLRMGQPVPADPVASPRDLAERLSPGEVAVALHVTADWIGAACIGRSRDGAVWSDCDIDKGWFTLADLSRLVTGKAEGDDADTGPAWHDLATLEPAQAESLVVNTCETIRNIVWPLVERLVQDKADALVLMPGRGLNVLPLHAAATSDNRLAIDRWAVRYAPSLNLFARAGDPGALGSAQTLGQAVNPTSDLPFAGPEAAAISQSWDGTRLPPLCGPDAQADRVLHLFGESDVLHFAGHGAFDPDDPLESHLSCAPDESGSAITLRRLLESGSSIRARAVLLSACETGLVVAGDPLNDQLGLPGGLLIAGASAVLATFWRVDDLAACLVLTRTVEFWKQQSIDLEQALAKAQEWLRTKATVQVVRTWIGEQPKNDAAIRDALDAALKSLAGLDENQLLFSNMLAWAPFHVSGRGIRKA